MSHSRGAEMKVPSRIPVTYSNATRISGRLIGGLTVATPRGFSYRKRIDAEPAQNPEEGVHGRDKVPIAGIPPEDEFGPGKRKFA